MLIEENSHLYTYAITRDFGFAPNPFHGICTLATCKPQIRNSAKIGDWIMGIGGSTLGPDIKRKCIFLMKVSEKIGFQNYWKETRFSLKKPCRNGSKVQMVGDNIYYKDKNGSWIQEDSHHSNADGTPNVENLKRDTGTDRVLISDHFFYFGCNAITIDLEAIDYGHHVRNCKKTDLSTSAAGIQLIKTIATQHHVRKNLVIADPCQFSNSHQRVDQITGKLS